MRWGKGKVKEQGAREKNGFRVTVSGFRGKQRVKMTSILDALNDERLGGGTCQASSSCWMVAMGRNSRR